MSDQKTAGRPQERTARIDDSEPLAVYSDRPADANGLAIYALGCIESDGSNDWHDAAGHREAFTDQVVLFQAHDIHEIHEVMQGRCIVTLAHRDREQRIAIQSTAGYLREMIRDLKGSR